MKNVFDKSKIERYLQFQEEDFPVLHEAAKNENIIIFIGAGVAKLYGCLLWNEMAIKLTEELLKKRLIDYAQQEVLIAEANTNPRKVISICYSLCRNKNKLEYYEEGIRKSINNIYADELNNIYEKIFSIGARAYLTTNIDAGINTYITQLPNWGRPREYNCTISEDQNTIEQISYNIFKDGNIIYLHGNYKNIFECVLPVKKYLEFYNEKNYFINSLFENLKRTGCFIVFIGYSLNEWDIIERIYKLRNNPIQNVGILLSPIYSHEIIRFTLEQEYYKSFGIEPIPYIIDETGYKELYRVLDNFQKALRKNVPSPYAIFQKIEVLSDKEKKLLDKIQKKTLYENKFFEKRSELKWFDELKKRGYFNPNPHTMPQESKDKGYFIIPYWNVLDYLEKVSLQVSQPGNEKYINELIEIIKNVTKYHIEHNKCLDNYHTWLYFVKILCNLPTEKITNEIIDSIPIWLESKFDNSFQADEILKNLLPKFLKSDKLEDLQKVEKIIDFVTQIKWVPKYTEEYKKEIKEKYKHIFDKPEEQRTEEEKLQIAFFQLEEYEPKTIVAPYLLIEYFIDKKIAIQVGEKCSEKVIFDLANKLKQIFQRLYKEKEGGEKYDLSYIWFGPLFAPEYINRAQEVLTLILRDIFLAKAKTNTEITKKIIEEFLSYEYPIFKRLVLFIISSIWGAYKSIFWELLNDDSKAVKLFNDPHYEAEVYTILEKYGNQFSTEEKEKIKNIIEGKVPREPHPEEKYKEYYSAYQRQKWYSALKSDDYFKLLYEKYKSITKEEEELSFKELKVRVGPGPSPLSKEEILKMSNRELAEFLKTFKTVDFWKGPTIGGLSDMLKYAVEEKPDKFVDDLTPFLKTGYLYVYKILWGIRDAWCNKKPIDWGKLFNFIKEYIRPDDFWDDKYKIEGDDWKANHLWVVGIIGELITQGTIDDAWAFSEEHFQIAQEILFLVLDNMLLEKDKILDEQSVKGDFVGYALNSPFGKITEALFMLALRIKRVEENSQKKQLVSWENSIRDKYESLLDNEIIESYVWLGRYLVNFFYYLDKEWTEKKIDLIINKNEQLWEAFMDGYLFGSSVYDDLYKLMKKHYKKAIDYQFKEKYTPDRLVQHICIGYLRGIEEIDNNRSLFRKLLDKWNTSQIIEMIDFFWMQRRNYERKPNKSVVLDKDGKPKIIENKQQQEQSIENEETKKIEDKIIDFWKWMYENKYKQKKELNDDDKKILSALCKLTVFLPEINSENFEWLKISALYVDIMYNSSFFIEYLNILKNKKQSIDFIGEVYLEMLKNTTPYFKQENIQSIVEFLYQKGKKKEANEICNIYASRGYEFLRPLWEQNNKT